MAKPRKINIHIDSTVTTTVLGDYSQKKVIYAVIGTKTSLRVHSLSTDIYYRVFIDNVLQPVWYEKLADWEDVPPGFHTTILANPLIGSHIKIEAYRFGKDVCIDANYMNSFVGFCSGVFTNQGLNVTLFDNVTIKEKKNNNEKRVY